MMPGGKSPPKIVVIDGLNVCHGGTNGEGWDGRRLLSCISKLESMGYGTIPVIGQWRLKEQIKKKTPGFKRVGKLRNRPPPFNLRTTQGEDDILALRLAVTENAWIITHDGFGKEREKYPEGIEGSSWEEIDELTVGTQWNGNWLGKGVHWNAHGSDFVWIDCPITEAPKELLIDEFEEERKLATEAKILIEKMHGIIEAKAKGRGELQRLLQASSILTGGFGSLNREFPEKKIGNPDQINDEFKLDDLRRFCSERGISKTGKKVDLIQRLIEYEEEKRQVIQEESDTAEKERTEDKQKKKEGRKEQWKLEQQQRLENAKSEAGIVEAKDIDSSAFFECLFSKMENPAEWTIFTIPYSRMLEEKPEFHLKSMGVRPTDYLKLHHDKIEISLRNDHYWIRKNNANS